MMFAGLMRYSGERVVNGVLTKKILHPKSSTSLDHLPTLKCIPINHQFPFTQQKNLPKIIPDNHQAIKEGIVLASSARKACAGSTPTHDPRGRDLDRELRFLSASLRSRIHSYRNSSFCCTISLGTFGRHPRGSNIATNSSKVSSP
jgi:hypothetical protein